MAQLLVRGADPGEADHLGRFACALAVSRGKRAVVTAFRKARAAEPQRWDWDAAKVPEALTAELEEKHEAKRKAKADAVKARIAAKQEKRRAAQEKERRERQKAEASGQGGAGATLGAAAAIGAAALVARKMASGRAAAAASDRELRAAAAERRLRAMGIGGGGGGNDAPACDACGKPIVGVPFERLRFKYCSTDCVHAHRKALGY